MSVVLNAQGPLENVNCGSVVPWEGESLHAANARVAPTAIKPNKRRAMKNLLKGNSPKTNVAFFRDAQISRPFHKRQLGHYVTAVNFALRHCCDWIYKGFRAGGWRI
jgi:hypothetical protein